MIYIEVLNREWEPGKLLTKKKYRKAFEDFVAEEYVKLVKKAIKDQRYATNWNPLSTPYFNYKRRNGLSLNMWEATGELGREIIYKKSSRCIGFDNRKRHHPSGIPLLKLARYLEYGTKRNDKLCIPPRPLFRSAYWYMKKHIRDYYIKFLRSLIDEPTKIR